MGNVAHAQPFRLEYTMGRHADGKHGTPENPFASCRELLLVGGRPCSKQQELWRGLGYAEPTHVAYFQAEVLV